MGMICAVCYRRGGHGRTNPTEDSSENIRKGKTERAKQTLSCLLWTSTAAPNTNPLNTKHWQRKLQTRFPNLQQHLEFWDSKCFDFVQINSSSSEVQRTKSAQRCGAMEVERERPNRTILIYLALSQWKSLFQEQTHTDIHNMHFPSTSTSLRVLRCFHSRNRHHHFLWTWLHALIIPASFWLKNILGFMIKGTLMSPIFYF